MRRVSEISEAFWVITSRLVSISFENIWFWLSRSSLLYMENFRIARLLLGGGFGTVVSE